MRRAAAKLWATYLLIVVTPLPSPATPVSSGEIGAGANWLTGPAPETSATAMIASTPEAIDCLTSTIYYEAARESRSGQEAVAQVVLNRLAQPGFPKTVCGVVYQGALRATGCQFTFACDGSLARRPVPAQWAKAREIATAALDGYVDAEIGTSTHYHAIWMKPYWASSLVATKRIGGHQFYREAASPALDTTAIGSAFTHRSAVHRARRQLAATSSQQSQFLPWGLTVATVSVQRGVIVVRAGG